MYEIVLNKCFGGFGLSPLALSELCKRKGVDCYVYVESNTNKGEYIQTSPIDVPPSKGFFTIYINKDLGKVINVYDLSKEDYVDLGDYIPRHDKDLVEVVKKLGDDANGYCADLRVEKISSKLYKINDYDGSETIMVPENIDWIIIEE